MRNSVIWSFFSIVALAGGGLLSGCDSDDAVAKSGTGESCDRTSDCADGLKCLEGACYPSASNGGSGNEGGADGGGGTTVIGPKPAVLGREGESCTKRADCEDGLGCYTGRCADDAGGEGGGSGNAGPRLGKPGETCTTSSDCEKSLSCIPGGIPTGEGLFPGAGYVGVCSVASTLTPSGKSCGAECREAADCCELPQAVHVAYSVLAPYGTGASSCSELRALLGTAKCATATGATGAQCAALAAYCECDDADDKWSCDAGSCSYTGACTEAKAADQPEGCPTHTRSGRTLFAACNSDGACAPEVTPVDVCKKNADCEDMPVTNDPTGASKVCSEDECVCHVESGACYRACDNDLDCDAGYTCDTDSRLCTQAAGCTTNEECVRSLSHPSAACDEGECKISCNTTWDCLNAGGPTVDALDAVDNIWICGQDNFCAALGCNSDIECAQTGTGSSRIRMFCTETPVLEGTAIQSAITD